MTGLLVALTVGMFTSPPHPPAPAFPERLLWPWLLWVEGWSAPGQLFLPLPGCSLPLVIGDLLRQIPLAP